MVVGVQPLRAGPLFDDVDAGTPQRFVWLPTDDPGAPKQRPAACDRLKLPSWDSKWVDPNDTIAAFFADEDQKRAELLDKPVDRDTLTVLKVPPEVTEVIDAVARGEAARRSGRRPARRAQIPVPTEGRRRTDEAVQPTTRSRRKTGSWPAS